MKKPTITSTQLTSKKHDRSFWEFVLDEFSKKPYYLSISASEKCMFQCAWIGKIIKTLVNCKK